MLHKKQLFSEKSKVCVYGRDPFFDNRRWTACHAYNHHTCQMSNQLEIKNYSIHLDFWIRYDNYFH
jgi:hypothetical protein